MPETRCKIETTAGMGCFIVKRLRFIGLWFFTGLKFPLLLKSLLIICQQEGGIKYCALETAIPPKVELDSNFSNNALKNRIHIWEKARSEQELKDHAKEKSPRKSNL